VASSAPLHVRAGRGTNGHPLRVGFRRLVSPSPPSGYSLKEEAEVLIQGGRAADPPGLPRLDAIADRLFIRRCRTVPSFAPALP
jgi:hypothetical protein